VADDRSDDCKSSKLLQSRGHKLNLDPQPISAMAAVTKNLAFGITASTTFEPPFLLAKRFSTLDHLTRGRIGWNIVTSWKKAAFKAIGLDNPIDHDERYQQADEYLRVLYK
jgi:alkanesulfonate monooxygenase SsuD/methylene tetrahydromethanopterin reductase-like flavin-dependent oxidoreductase (luciferase family)